MSERDLGVEGPEEGLGREYGSEEPVGLGDGGLVVESNPEEFGDFSFVDNPALAFLFVEGGVQIVGTELENVILGDRQNGKSWSDLGGFVLSIEGLVSLIHLGIIDESVIDQAKDLGEEGGVSEAEVVLPIALYNLFEFGQKEQPKGTGVTIPSLRKKIRVMPSNTLKRVYGVPDDLAVHVISADREWKSL